DARPVRPVRGRIRGGFHSPGSARPPAAGRLTFGGRVSGAPATRPATGSSPVSGFCSCSKLLTREGPRQQRVSAGAGQHGPRAEQMSAEPALTAPSGRPPSDAAAPEPAEFRKAMAEFATGVTLVTAVDAGEPVGFACQSFASVSLEPPLILFCADKRGRSWPRIRSAGYFCVNVLAEEQRDLCERFGSRHGAKFHGLHRD